MPKPVRVWNRRPLRRPLLWGGAALFAGCLLFMLSSWLVPDVFDALGSTAIAQAGSALLGLLGIAILIYGLARHPLWVEFGERVRIRWGLWQRVLAWDQVRSLALEGESVAVQPLAPLANLSAAVGVPVVGPVLRLTGAASIAEFKLHFGRICLTLSSGEVIRCDVRLLEWESIVEVARKQGAQVLPG